MSYPSRTERRKGRVPAWPFLSFALLCVALAVLLGPSFTYIRPSASDKPSFIYRGEPQRFPLIMEGSEAYLPFSFVKETVDPDAFWDEGQVVVTTKDKVVKMRTDSTTAYVNQNPVDLRLPVIQEGGEPYIPASTLMFLYPLSLSVFPEIGIVQAKRTDIWVMSGTVKQGAILRLRPSSLAPRLGNLEVGNEVEVFQMDGNWLRVESSTGLYGFLMARDVTGIESRAPKVTGPEPYVPVPISGREVGLVWEQVDRRTPDPWTLPEMPGLNVVSPTWLHLGEEPGQVLNYIDSRYVDWAHGRGYQVWALFSNSFELERTRTMLRDSSLRDKVVSQILLLCQMYSLDGINLDFENVYAEDAQYFTQFVRELAPLLHQEGLTVSVDVTVKSMSPTWSMCYERAKLAGAVDYVMLMAYDEFWASSPVAGPVSSIPWTEWTIQTTLKEVPAEKLILGVPFYTRIWKETTSEGRVTVTQGAYGMKSTQEWLLREGLTPVPDAETGLSYAEKRIGQENYRVWIEDSDSMRSRTGLARKYDLAGIGAWRRGFETPDIWDVIEEYTR